MNGTNHNFIGFLRAFFAGFRIRGMRPRSIVRKDFLGDYRIRLRFSNPVNRFPDRRNPYRKFVIE